jgi:hypothetical protein
VLGDFHARGEGLHIHLFGCAPGSDFIRQRLDNAGGGAAKAIQKAECKSKMLYF